MTKTVSTIIVAITTAALILGSAGCRPEPPVADTAPVVVGTEPADGAAAVSPDSRIGVSFSRSMQIASVAEHITITPAVAGPWRSEEGLVYIQPVEPLKPGETYTITLAPGALAEDGAACTAGGTWSFTVAEPSVGQLPGLRSLAPLPALPGVLALTFGPESGPSDVDLYVASDQEVGRLARAGSSAESSGGEWSYETLSDGWSGIEDIAFDHEGNLWLAVAEKENYRVVRLGADGREVLTLPVDQPQYPEGSWNWFYPRSLAFAPNGDILLLGTDRVRRMDPTTGEVREDLGVGVLSGAVTEGYFGPSGLLVDESAELVWVNNGFNYGPTGGVVGLSLVDGQVVESYRVGVSKYRGLARDQWGNFYLVSDFPEPHHLRVLGPDGLSLDNLAVPDRDISGYAHELAVFGDILYVTDGHAGVILRYSLSGD